MTFIVSKFPRKLEKELKKRKITLVKRGDGIYDISEEMFKTQIIINRELDEKENLWLRCLDHELKEQRLYKSLEKEYEQHKNEARYRAPMNAIIWSNYQKEGEVKAMCEALYDLFADELVEREDKGIARGKAEDVLELLEDVGKCSGKLEKCVMEERDIATLRKWLKLAARAESIEEFEEKSGIILS